MFRHLLLLGCVVALLVGCGDSPEQRVRIQAEAVVDAMQDRDWPRLCSLSVPVAECEGLSAMENAMVPDAGLTVGEININGQGASASISDGRVLHFRLTDAGWLNETGYPR